MNTKSYIDQLFVREDALLKSIRQDIEQRGMPTIYVDPAVGQLLYMLVKMHHSAHVVEIGALGGYSGVWLARALPSGGHLTSLEINTDYAGVAATNMAKAGLQDKVNYRIGPAAQSLEEMVKESQRFDFFFIDADKENYSRYLELAIQLASPGAIIAADNTLWGGAVLNSSDSSPSTQALQEFNRKISADPRLCAMLIPLGDGLSIATVETPSS